MQRHQLLHHLRRGQLLPDAALPAAQIHQLPQQAVVYPLLAALQYALLRVAQPVDEGLIQHLVPHADLQRPAHEVQQLLSAGAIGVRQIRLLQHLIRLVHVLGQLDGQFVLAFEVVIDIAHGAAGGLCDLLHGDVFKALPVKQIQRRLLDPAAHLHSLPLSCGDPLCHRTFPYVVNSPCIIPF